MVRARNYGVRLGLVAPVLAAALLGTSCSVPAVGIVSPHYGASAPGYPGSWTQTALIGICSPLGGPVRVTVDIANPDSNTELMFDYPDSLDFGPEVEEAVGWFRGEQSHYEFESVNSLEPGACPGLTITTSQYHSTDPAEVKSFTYGVWW